MNKGETLRGFIESCVNSQYQNAIAEFAKPLSLDLPYAEATHIDHDEKVYWDDVDEMAVVGAGDLDSGYKVSQVSKHKHRDDFVYLRGASETQTTHMDAIGSADFKRLVSDNLAFKLQKAGGAWETTLINGILASEEDTGFKSLSNRCNVITDLDGEILNETTGAKTGVFSRYTTLDMKGGKVYQVGVNGVFSSLYIVYPNVQSGVSIVYPKGNAYRGFEISDRGVNKTTLANGNSMFTFDVTYCIAGGLRVADKRALTRIANISTDDGSEQAVAPALLRMIREAFERIPNEMRSGIRIYTTPRVISMLSNYFTNKTQPITREEAMRLGITSGTYIDEFLLVPCHSMLNTENRVEGV